MWGDAGRHEGDMGRYGELGVEPLQGAHLDAQAEQPAHLGHVRLGVAVGRGRAAAAWEIQGDVARYGEIWGDVARYGEIWGGMGVPARSVLARSSRRRSSWLGLGIGIGLGIGC